MTCYQPNKMFVVGLLPNGKKNLIFTSGTDCQGVHSDHPQSKRWSKIYCDPQDVVDMNELSRYNEYLWVHRSNLGTRWYCFDYIEVPCGQCKGCRVDRSRQWADRMLMEASYYDDNCFVTLTYDDDHVPTSAFVSDSGDSLTSLTLRKRDFQLFMKRLRRYVERDGEDPIRFYAAGEYGDTTYRPHYHAILFNYWPKDAVLDHVSPNGDAFYTSETISKAWQHQGFILVSRVSWDTCAYTARYVTKKLNGEGAGLYSHLNIEPPFSLQSRRPGIARQYYEDHKDDIYQLDKVPNIYVSTPKGGRKMKPPRYFDMLFDIDYPDESDRIRQARKTLAQKSMLNKLRHTSLDKWKLLSVQEAHFSAKIKSLKRDAV